MNRRDADSSINHHTAATTPTDPNDLARHELSFFVGPDTDERVEALMEAIMELPQFKEVGGGAVGARKLLRAGPMGPLSLERLDALQHLVAIHSTPEAGEWATFLALLRRIGADVRPEGVRYVE